MTRLEDIGLTWPVRKPPSPVSGIGFGLLLHVGMGFGYSYDGHCLRLTPPDLPRVAARC